MKITREIGGQMAEINLTPDEMVKTYYEQQRKNDMEDMEEYLFQFEDSDFEEYFGCPIAEAESELDELARLMRTNMEKYDLSWENARYEAISDWSYERRESA